MLPMTRRVGILVVITALVGAACGDDDPFGAVTTAPSQATTATTVGTDDTSGSTLPDETSQTSEAGATTTATAAGAEGDIEALLERYRSVPLRVTYLVGGDPDAQTVTLSQDPTQTPPVMAVIMYEGPEPDSLEEARVLTIGDRTLICGPPGPDNICVESPPTPGGGPSIAEGVFGPLVSAFLLELELSDTPGFSVDESGITVAGREGVCFTHTPTAYPDADVAFLRQCVDSESGFMLLVEAKEAEGETAQRVLELIDFGQPRPGDFEPTGEVMTMPEG
jgi:hypothetical protein